MAQNLKKEFHTSLANQFVKEVQLLKGNLYYFLGKVSSWGSPDFPPENEDTLNHDDLIRKNMVYLNKVMPNDITLCVKRYDWMSGTFYARWDDKADLTNTKFYVLTSDYRVYKCLDNNMGAASTVEPSEADGINAFRTTDGYVWKYMYTIPAFKQFKFVNSQYIPVQTAVSESFYNRGAVEDVIINQPGSGYSSTTATVISVTGTGSGAVLIPVIDLAGSIIDVKIINGGANYSTPPTLTVAGSGTHKYPENSGGAILEAIVSAGVIVDVLVRDPGISYTSNNSTTINVKGDGTGAVFTPVVYGGSLIDVVIENNGTGYSYMELTVVGTGTGAVLTANIGINDIISDQSVVEQLAVPGAIFAARIVNPGALYDLLTVPKITVFGDGKNATAQAIMDNGSLVGVQMLTFGQDYTYSTFSVEAPANPMGTTAIVEAIKTPYYGHGYDAVNEFNSNVICVSSVLNANSLVSEINQDYRQYGLFKNPRNIANQSFTGVTSSLLVYKMRMLTTAGLQVDAELNSALNYRYLVVKYDSVYAYLQPVSGNNVPPLGALSGDIGTFFASEVISSPTVNKYSGEVLTIASEVPFKFTSEQSLALQTYIKC
jgi:hypothetical protein